MIDMSPPPERGRFVRNRIAGLTDEYRSGRPRSISDDRVAEVIKRTLETTAKGRKPLVAPLNGLQNRAVRYDDPR